MTYELMRVRKTAEIVRMYSLDMSRKMALCWNERLYQSQNGNGWIEIPYKNLVPMEYEANPKDYVSKTQKGKAKKRLKLIDATWQTSNGTLYPHSALDIAIEEELEIMEKEKNG